MGLFNGKEVNELVVKTLENTSEIVAVKRELENSKQELEKFKIEQEERIKEITEVIMKMKLTYEEKLKLIENEKLQLTTELEDAITTQNIKKDKLTIIDVCKHPGILNLNTAEFKYHLYKNGVMNMSINKERNSFTLNTESLNRVDPELRQHIVLIENKLLFNNSIIEYIKKHEQEISESASQYILKQEQYKISRRNLENRNVKNYKEEIKAICGTDSNEKWNAIYREFSKKFKNWYMEYKKYAKDHREGEYEISRVKYVVTIMGEGNFLLKIACDLFA